MAENLKIVGSPSCLEALGPALRESGFDVRPFSRPEEALSQSPDGVVFSSQDPGWESALKTLREVVELPVLTLVKKNLGRAEIEKFRGQASLGYIREDAPIDEVVVRLKAMMEKGADPAAARESRAAKRIWFQQPVKFKVFDREHIAWSTTLSETGIFLRTQLSFPLYTVIRLQFDIPGAETFECDGVIVRQEVEGAIRGMGVMFQNLKGDGIASLESLLQWHRS